MTRTEALTELAALAASITAVRQAEQAAARRALTDLAGR